MAYHGIHSAPSTAESASVLLPMRGNHKHPQPPPLRPTITPHHYAPPLRFRVSLLWNHWSWYMFLLSLTKFIKSVNPQSKCLGFFGRQGVIFFITRYKLHLTVHTRFVQLGTLERHYQTKRSHSKYQLESSEYIQNLTSQKPSARQSVRLHHMFSWDTF